MYGCESWTVKKAEHQRIDAFELRCWRRLLRVPWTSRRSNESILKEISPGISLEGMMLKLNSSTLATSCKELIHWKRLWCWEGLGAGGKGDDRGWDGWMASLTQWMWIWVNSGSWWWTGRPSVLRFMGSQRVGYAWATALNWTVLQVLLLTPFCRSEDLDTKSKCRLLTTLGGIQTQLYQYGSLWVNLKSGHLGMEFIGKVRQTC